MKLRSRLLLSIGFTLVCLIAGVHLLSSKLLLQSFAGLEQQSVNRDVERVNRTFTQMYANMKTTFVSWAQWDDTYKFMSDHNQEYINSNIVDSALSKMDMDIVVFLDTHERIFFAHPVKRLNNVRPPETDQILRLFRQSGSFASVAKGGDSVCGVVMLPDSPLFLCAMPILPTSGKGQPRGWILFGHYFDKGQLQQLKDNTRLDVQVIRLDDAKMPPEYRQALGSLSAASPISVRPQDQKTVAGYTRVNDVFGKPVLLLRVTETRAIYARGLASVSTLSRLILIAGAIFGVVILFVLERFALSRLSRLSSQVNSIGTGTAVTRVQLPGRDELSGLASAINGMLGKLERVKEQLRLYNENLEQTVQERTQEIAAKNAVLEHAVEGIAQLDIEGRYVAVNAAYARMLGYTPEELIGQPWTISVPEAEQANVRAAFHTMLQEGKSETQTQAVRKDGTLF